MSGLGARLLGRIRSVVEDVRDLYVRGESPRGEPQYHVLFVCFGNICRSPMALGILRHQLQQEGLYGAVRVGSSGISAINLGRSAHWRARVCARHHGIPLGDHRARQFHQGDFDLYDIIYVMDESNRTALIQLARSAHDREKVRTLLAQGGSQEIPDPVLGRNADFERVYSMIEAACTMVMEEIRARFGLKVSRDSADRL